jgi:hypothetical protein
MKIQIICILLLIVLALSCLCVYLWHEVERNADLAEQWASRAGYSEGRVKILNDEVDELINVWLRIAYEKGLRDGDVYNR